MPTKSLEEEVFENHVFLVNRNLFAREGEKDFADAVSRGFTLVSAIVSDEPEHAHLAEYVEKTFPDAHLNVANMLEVDNMIKKIYHHDTLGHYTLPSIKATFRMPDLPDAEDVLPNCKTIVVLDDVNTPINLVAITNLALSYEVDALIIAGNTRFTYSQRLFRETRGAIHDLTIARIRSWPEGIESTLRKHGFTSMAMALKDNAIDARDLHLEQYERVAVILGNENSGLDVETIDLCDITVKIPMSRNVDSLNVSNACAIMLYELGKEKPWS